VPVAVDQNGQSRQNWQKVKQVATGVETLSTITTAIFQGDIQKGVTTAEI